MRNAADQVPSLAPTNRNMIMVTAAENDSVLSARDCPACDEPFLGGQNVFVNVGETIAIHATCVVTLALLASVKTRPDAEIEAEAREKTAELLRVLHGEDQG